MSITDELREWAETARVKDVALTTYPAQHAVHGIYEQLLAIADRIDAEHQKAEDEWKAKHGQMWLKGYSECHAELPEGNETLATDLERCGWIRLPRDADGEYININDWIEVDDGKRVRVDAIAPNAVYWWDGDGCHWCQSFMVSHYHATTVEDVLREFANEVYADADNEIRDQDFLCAKYAKRLTLAEGEGA